MRARVLVVKFNDGGEEWIDPAAIADEYTLEANPEWLAERASEQQKMHDQAYVTHGFVDIEIPDAVIESVTRQHADAGTVEAKGVDR